MTKQGFLDALGKLADDWLMVTEEKSDKLVKFFDVNGDGMISVTEFKAYCLFQIPGVAWKAERRR
jgi:Ca2+-binding EF-hand superfamily protein